MTIFEAVFATVKNNEVSHYFVIYSSSRAKAAERVAKVLKNRCVGSLLDVSLAEADDVRAAVREVDAQEMYA
jgi:hypothetical protein